MIPVGCNILLAVVIFAEKQGWWDFYNRKQADLEHFQFNTNYLHLSLY